MPLSSDQETRLWDRWESLLRSRSYLGDPESSLDTPLAPQALEASFLPAEWCGPDQLAPEPPSRQELPDACKTTLAFHDAFEVTEVLGRGGMGTVFRARQVSLERDVALKQLTPKRGRSTPAMVRLFRDEARLMGRLEHPNIMPIHGAYIRGEGETSFLVMKLLEARPWSEILNERPADLSFHLHVLLQVSQAVSFAHSRGIVHNDLKPSNVLLGDFGEVRVADWGLAACFTNRLKEVGLRHVTDIRSPCGTPAYMAPELAEGLGDQVGPHTDVFLLGGILYRILHRTPPHRGKTAWDVIVSAAQGVQPPPHESVATELEDIYRQAMAFDPKERFGNAREFHAALASFLSHKESVAIESHARRTLQRCKLAELSKLRQPEGAHVKIYDLLNQAVGAFQQASRLWPEKTSARLGIIESRLQFAQTACARGDLSLAETQLLQCDPRHLDEAPDELEAAWKGLRETVALAHSKRTREGLFRKRLQFALAASLVLVVGILVSSVVLLKTEVKQTLAEKAAKVLALHNLELEKSASDRAFEQLRAEKATAEMRGQIAVQALLKMSHPFQIALQHEFADQRSLQIAKELLVTVIDGWEQLRRAEIAQAFALFGDAMVHLYSGDMQGLIDGDAAGAVQHYEAAHSDLVALHDSDLITLDSAEIVNQLFRCKQSLGHMHQRLGQSEAALEYAVPAFTHWQSKAMGNATSESDVLNFATAAEILARIYLELGQQTEGHSTIGESLRIQDEYHARLSKAGATPSADAMLYLSSTMYKRARSLEAIGDPRTAHNLFVRATVYAESASVWQPERLSAQSNYAIILNGLAANLANSGHAHEAETAAVRAVEILAKVRAMSPRSAESAFQLAQGKGTLAVCLAKTERHTIALQEIQEAITVQEEVPRSRIGAELQLAQLRIRLAKILLMQSRSDEAEDPLIEAQLALSGLLVQAPERVDVVLHLLDCHRTTSRLLEQGGDYEGSYEILTQSFEMLAQLDEEMCQLTSVKLRLGEVYSRMSRALKHLRRIPESREALHQALQIHQAPVKNADESHQFRLSLGANLRELAIHCEMDGEIDASLDHLRRSTELLRQLRASDSGNVDLKVELATSCSFLGRLLFLRQRNEDARSLFLECLKVDPGNTEAFRYLGDTTLFLEGPEASTPWYRRACEVSDWRVHELHLRAALAGVQLGDTELAAQELGEAFSTAGTIRGQQEVVLFAGAYRAFFGIEQNELPRIEGAFDWYRIVARLFLGELSLQEAGLQLQDLRARQALAPSVSAEIDYYLSVYCSLHRDQERAVSYSQSGYLQKNMAPDGFVYVWAMTLQQSHQ